MITEGKLPNNFFAQLEVDRVVFENNREYSTRNLVLHIFETHFRPDILAWMGVAIYDIKLAQLVNISLERVVDEGYKRLEVGWGIDEAFFDHYPTIGDNVLRKSGLPWNRDWARMMIIKNLRYIEECRVGEIDWIRVERASPNAKDITLDLEKDAYDISDY